MAFDETKPANDAPLVSADVRDNFVHIKTAISKEHVWDDNNPQNTSHRLDQINAIVTGSKETSWSGSPKAAGGAGSVLTRVVGVAAGTYTLQNLIQQLVTKSHTHGGQVFGNTQCDCQCGDS
ncbi:MAG: hypothetical protein H6Q72_1907 [Firmicutes bacterium]|nr:hypothetical protein [Bacillota bacterium]